MNEMLDDLHKYETGMKRHSNFIPKRPGYTRINFRRPRISDRLKWWLGIGKLCGYAPAPITCTTIFRDTLFIAAGATVYRLDKVNNEMVIVPFHEAVCNKCKGDLS